MHVLPWRTGIAIDGQIHPLAVRRDLELRVALDVLEVASNEDFRNIPVPKLVGFVGGGGVWLRIKLFVLAEEEQVEVLVAPARSDFRMVVWSHIPERSTVRRHAPDCFPLA